MPCVVTFLRNVGTHLPGVCLNILSVVEACSASSVNNKLERVCKEAVVAVFEVLYEHLRGGTEKKITKHLGHNNWFPRRDLNS